MGLAQVASGGSWLALLPCLPSVTLVRPRQWIHGLASLWVWPAGLSSSSRSLLGSLLRHLAPPTCQTPSSSLPTTCVSSRAWDGPSIQQVTSLARLTSRLVQPK